ncbi:MAG: hypothetical protein H6719_14465 [Sandaracinaceae bacterium]|nr:hypothetical protein [Sandaracinaceae bacterium]
MNDPSLTVHERAARPWIDRFARSPRCPAVHRHHAGSSLLLVASFVSMHEEHDSRGLPWHRLSPDGLAEAMLSCDASARGRVFLRDVLDVTSAFYGFLAEAGLLRRTEALGIQRRLVELALAFAHS